MGTIKERITKVMRWIKKEMDEDGRLRWAVYIDKVGDGNEEDWSHFETYPTRKEAIENCKHVTWEDYDSWSEIWK